MALEQLEAPPIDEVICGVIHEPLPQLDPVITGLYWEKRRAEYPNRQLLPAIADEPSTFVLAGVPPLRTWFVSKDGTFVLQFQRNRFHMNWRKRASGQSYPRFSDHGSEKGIESLFIEEFKRYSEFCRSELGAEPEVNRVEVSKIDLLREDVHWSGFPDLAQMLPWLSQFAAFSLTDNPAVSLRYQEERPTGRLTVTLDLGPMVAAPSKRAVRLESRVSKQVTGNLATEFSQSNKDLNDVFEKLIPADQRAQRFKGG